MGRSAQLETQPLLRADEHEIVARAIDEHQPIARLALLSGGNDSTVMTDWAWRHHYIDAALHIDTGTGIYETQVFVRRFCRQRGIPLHVYSAAPGEYERMIARWGFPGPAGHGLAYQRLKERPLARAIADLKAGHRRDARVLLLTGVRRSESERRMGTAAEIDRRGAKVFCAPLIDWTHGDLHAYRDAHQVPRSPVADLIHLSGECLCGAFAKPDERQELATWFPAAWRRIEQLEAMARRLGVERNQWGARHGNEAAGEGPGPMCSSCKQMELLGQGACETAPPAARPAPRRYGSHHAPQSVSVLMHSPASQHTAPPVQLDGITSLTAGGNLISLDAQPVARLHARASDRLEVLDEDRAGHLGARLNEHPALRRLVQEQQATQHSAVDVIGQQQPTTSRRRRRRPSTRPLAVYVFTPPELGAEHLDTGPYRLRNEDGRQDIERVRIINRTLLLDELAIAKYLVASDSICRDFAPLRAGHFWQVREVGRFAYLLAIPASAAGALEAAWARSGFVAGHMTDNGPWVAPTVTPAYRIPAAP